MIGRGRSPVRVLALAAALFATGCPSPRGGPPRPPEASPFVLAPEGLHYGASYAEWSQRWWQWAFELPRAGHPLYDETGQDALAGQIPPVYFLGGVFTANGQPVDPFAVRSIEIPSGTALFFPVINSGWDNTNCLGPDTDWSFTEMRGFVADAVESYVDLLCEVDGVTVIDSPDLAGAVRFRAQAPAFSLRLTADNIYFDFCGGVPLPPRTVDPFASDGIWMMIGPMPAGGHTLTFGGTQSSNGFRTEVTYHVTVLP
jgi:hypothetical protein